VLFGLEGIIEGMGISPTTWLGISVFSVWLKGRNVVDGSHFFVWLVRIKMDEMSW
jgi:hypothetical protein